MSTRPSDASAGKPLSEVEGHALADCAPIALFAYKRPWHLRETVEALRRNQLASQSDLHIFCDGSKDASAEVSVRQVRDYVRRIAGFKSVTIHERTENAGLARSIVSGVTTLCEAAGRVIVLEDDLVTSRWFLDYMNRALVLYENDQRVAAIHGYCYPVGGVLPDTFFIRGADCWGWATWGRAWRQFEPDGGKLLQELIARGLQDSFDLGGAYGYTQMLRDQISGKNDSWAIRWHASCFLKDLLTLYPGRSLVQNIGMDDSGTHCGNAEGFATTVADHRVPIERITLGESLEANRAFARFLRRSRGSLVRRALRAVARQTGLRG